MASTRDPFCKPEFRKRQLISDQAEIWEAAMAAFNRQLYRKAILLLESFLRYYNSLEWQIMAHAHLGESHLHLVPETYHQQKMPKRSSVPDLVAAYSHFDAACQLAGKLKARNAFPADLDGLQKDCTQKATSLALILDYWVQKGVVNRSNVLEKGNGVNLRLRYELS